MRTGSEDQHYCAHRMIDLIGSFDTPVVAEIGGGFGGMAYYLIRDLPSVTYLNFDMPETIALASYYLLNAFPQAKAILYGEAELNAETLRSSQIILMPSFAIPQLPPSRVDIAFNARIASVRLPTGWTIISSMPAVHSAGRAWRDNEGVEKAAVGSARTKSVMRS